MNSQHPDPVSGLSRIDALHRQQLSALIDGELDAYQARFLIRRLEHDDSLSGCQERWLIAGDVLRGQLAAVAPVDFAARVAAALPAATAPSPARRGAVRRWPWAAGGALAAGMALLAVIGLPQQPAPQAPAVPEVASAPPVVAPVMPDSVPVVPVVPVPAVVAPRTVAAAPSPRPATAPRAAAVASRAAPAPVTVAAQSPTSELLPATGSPFALPVADPPARPWPRSRLPAGDTFNVRLPAQGSSPFALPASDVPAGWSAAPAD